MEHNHPNDGKKGSRLPPILSDLAILLGLIVSIWEVIRWVAACFK